MGEKLTKSNYWVYYDFNSSALYPNATAHPFKADFSYQLKCSYGISSTAYGLIQIGGTSFLSNSTSSKSYQSYSESGKTDSAIVNSTRGTTIRAGLQSWNIFVDACMNSANVTLYFTRYDFSASAGSGVTSASVSSSTGYDGDTVTFSCVIPTGYAFDGWYSGNTKVSGSQSYTHTVAGADLSLTAKAHQNTHSVNGTYNGSTKAILTGISGNVGVTYNGKTKTMPTDGTEFTLGETNKAMHTDVTVGSAEPLHCAEKLLYSPLVLNYV